MPNKRKSSSKSKARAPVALLRSDPVQRFYAGASGAFRLADPATAATALYPMVEDVLVGANSTGDVVQGFLPSVALAQQNCVVTTGSLAATWTTTAHPQAATLYANCLRARMTGWRITVRYVGAAQTAAGTMFVGPSSAFYTTMVSSGLSNYTPQMREYSLVAGKEYVFYAPMLGLPDFEKANDNAFCFNYWSGMVFIFRGLPVSTPGVLSIRSERSIEYQPELSLNSIVEARPEPFDPVQQYEAGVLSGTAQEEGEDSGPNWTAKVGKAAYTLVRGAGAAVLEAARSDLRDHLSSRRLRMLEM